jgi:hypothetical protein
MEQTAKAAPYSSIEEAISEIQKLNRLHKAESFVHLAMAGVCQSTHLNFEQKADIVTIALEMHRAAAASQILEMIATGPGRMPFDLVTPGDDANKAELMRALVARALLVTEDVFQKKAQRFSTMCEMLAPPQDGEG